MDNVDFSLCEPGWALVYRELDRLGQDYLHRAALSADHDTHTVFRGRYEAYVTIKETLAKLRRDILKEP